MTQKNGQTQHTVDVHNVTCVDKHRQVEGRIIHHESKVNFANENPVNRNKIFSANTKWVAKFEGDSSDSLHFNPVSASSSRPRQ